MQSQIDRTGHLKISGFHGYSHKIVGILFGF